MKKLDAREQRFVEEYLIDLNAWEADRRAGFGLQLCDGSANGCYVYGLLDPRNGNIFYVGKGTGRRFEAHILEWGRGQVGNVEKFSRIDQIVRSGNVPDAVYLAQGLSDGSALGVEGAFIRAIGLSLLTNAGPGQTSERERTIAWARSRVEMLQPFDQWCSERHRTEKEKALYRCFLEAMVQAAVGDYRDEMVIEQHFQGGQRVGPALVGLS